MATSAVVALSCHTLPALAGGLFSRMGKGSTPAAARPAGEVILPRSTLSWSIESVQGSHPTPVMCGESIIGPTGALLLGPYGAVTISGMTTAQAEVVVVRELKSHVKNPRVRLSLLKSGSGAPVAGGEPPHPGHLVPVAYQAPAVPARSQPPEECIDPPLPTESAPPVLLRAGLGRPVDLPAATEPPPLALPEAPLAETPPVMIAPHFQGAPVASVSLAGDDDGSRGGVPGEPLPRTEGAVPPQGQASEWRPLNRQGPMPRGSVTPAAWTGANPAGTRLASGMGMEPPFETIPKSPRPLPQGPPAVGGPVVLPDGVLPHGPGPHMDHPQVPRECDKRALPSYVIEPPDILLVQSTKSIPNQPVQGQHLVRPDGKISLGIYGEVHVAGLTIEDARLAVFDVLRQRISESTEVDGQVKKTFQLRDISVDVLAYNSKWYYVITDGGGYGEQIQRFAFTGNETVLDALSQIQGLPPVASRHHIWLARPVCSPFGAKEKVLPIDYVGVTQCADNHTNYQVMPGDRVYVKAQKIITVDSTIAKFISPIERLLGVTLLASTTVNSFRNNGNNNNNNFP